MGSVLRSVGASQGNIWTVAPFIPVKMGSKNTKSAKNQKAPNRCCWNFQDFLDRVPGAQISWSGKRRIFWPIPSLRHGVPRTHHKNLDHFSSYCISQTWHDFDDIFWKALDFLKTFLFFCKGYTAWAPDGREGWSQDVRRASSWK